MLYGTIHSDGSSKGNQAPLGGFGIVTHLSLSRFGQRPIDLERRSIFFFFMHDEEEQGSRPVDVCSGPMQERKTQ